MPDTVMDVVTFSWKAKYGHFLRAEANVNGLTYPVPPRTAVLGLLAAILGIEKDGLPTNLDGAMVAVTGHPPHRFWNTIKLRKDPPTPLPQRIERGRRLGSQTKPETATLVRQEWLWKPEFRILAAVPDSTLFSDLEKRIRTRQWYFTPCMGLSEFLADVIYEE